MAIATQKLLPQSGRTGARMSSSIVKTSSLSLGKSSVYSTSSTGLSGQALSPIYKTLIDINSILSRRKNETVKENKKIKDETDKKQKKITEDALELKTEKKKINFPKIKTPFASFFDRLKNALVLFLVGWLVNRFFEYIPKILEGISKFTETLETIRTFLKPATDALGSALYNVTLAGTKMLGAITGAQIDENEKNLAVAINELDKKFSIINALMAGIIIGDIFSAVADGLDLFGRPGRGGPGSSLFGRGLRRAPGRLAARVLGRGGLKAAGKVFGRIPIIGGLIDFIINLAMGEKPGRAAAKAVGATLGAGLGSLIPVPFAGTILGGFLGDLLGGKIYDMFMAPQQQGPGEAPKQAGDGITGTPLGEGQKSTAKDLSSKLTQRGFTREEAAAIVGNIWAESGFRTNAVNNTSGAYGLMQWLGDRKSKLIMFANRRQRPASDLETQLDYIKWELKGGNKYETRQFRKAMGYGPTIADKTKGFAYEVERASFEEIESSLSKRIGAAQSAYGQGGSAFSSADLSTFKKQFAKIKSQKPQSISASSYSDVSNFPSYDRDKVQLVRQTVYVPMGQGQMQQSSGPIVVVGGGVNNIDYQIAARKAAL